MSAYQNDSKVQNEIVTLRGGMCLVVAKTKISPRRRGGRGAEESGTGKQPQISADER